MEPRLVSIKASGFPHRDASSGVWQNMRASEMTGLFEGSLIRFLKHKNWSEAEINEVVAKPPQNAKGGGGRSSWQDRGRSATVRWGSGGGAPSSSSSSWQWQGWRG